MMMLMKVMVMVTMMVMSVMIEYAILLFKKCTAFSQGGIDGWHTSPQR